mgnify:CR=1 FL=1
MKHAYLILAHHEPEVLQLLLTSLDDARNDIFLHIDRRSKRLFARFEKWQPQSAGFFLLEEREAPAWGHISIVRAELRLFSAALAQGEEYAYYHLLSGMDLPLKSQDEIHDFFDAQHPEILETIRETKDLPEEAVLDAAITEFLNQSSFQ